MADEQLDRIRTQFGRQALRFNEPGRTITSGEYLRWVVGLLALSPSALVLDVAAGTGLLGRAIAPLVSQVVAVDVTPQMLRRGIAEAEREGLRNILFEGGRAEQLRFPDGSFDVVVTRLSLHHMADPGQAVREMARVCDAGGQVAVIDLVSPEEPALAQSCDRIERLRDPSHTRSLTAAALGSALGDAGLERVALDSRTIEVDPEPWFALTGTDPAVQRAVRREWEAELDGGAATGMRPFRRDGRILFRQTWTAAVGVKRKGPSPEEAA